VYTKAEIDCEDCKPPIYRAPTGRANEDHGEPISG